MKGSKHLIVAMSILFLAVVYANSCGGNCPSGKCTSCICGTAPAHANVAAECKKFNGWS